MIHIKRIAFGGLAVFCIFIYAVIIGLYPIAVTPLLILSAYVLGVAITDEWEQ